MESVAEDSPGPSSTLRYCCLIDNSKRCVRLASNHSLNKRVERAISVKRLKLTVDSTAHHTHVCVYHYRLACPINQKPKGKIRKCSDSDDTSNKTHIPRIKLHLASASSLRRIKKFVRAQPPSGLNKKQLADEVSQCLQDVPVNEKEIITYFIYTVKTDKNKLDLKV